MERTNDVALNVSSAVCVCVCVVLHLDICCFHFSDIVCFVFYTFRCVVTETIPFASLMCRYSNKTNSVRLMLPSARRHCIHFRVVLSMICFVWFGCCVEFFYRVFGRHLMRVPSADPYHTPQVYHFYACCLCIVNHHSSCCGVFR